MQREQADYQKQGEGHAYEPLSYIMTSAEVGHKFNVDAKTVSRWARDKKITYKVTPGGQRRFSMEELEVSQAELEKIRAQIDEERSRPHARRASLTRHHHER